MAESGERRSQAKGAEYEEPVPLASPFEGEPPVMWPGADSGFEADPFSPAGTAQREWALWQRLGRTRAGKVAVWIVLGLVVLVPVISILEAVLRRH